jgi:PPE-repeat protein
MDFAMLPPEVNSGRMYAGPGSGPMLAAAAAWDALAAELQGVGRSYESVISELASGWMGPSATAMANAAAPYAMWMHDTAAQAEHTATQAKAAAAAYESAYSAIVPPPLIATNRSQLMSLVQTNLLGQNTPAIAATETAYGEMWAQDVTAMYGYAGNSSTASTLTPFGPPPQTTNPAGSVNQAGAAGQAAATSAGSHAQTAVSSLSAAPQALQGLTSPAASMALSSPAQAGPSSILGALLSGLPSVGSDPALAAAYTGLAASLFGSLVIDSAGSFGIDSAGSFGIDLIGVGEIEGAEEGLLPFGGQGPAPVLPSTGTGAAPVLASTGQASPVGGLSVPPSWTAAAPPPIQQVSTDTALAADGDEAAPAVAAGAPRLPLTEMATAGLAGRATAAVGRGRRERAGATTRKGSSKSQTPAGGPITRIAPELRELAELRDAGILTDEEFNAQKQRLLGN